MGAIWAAIIGAVVTMAATYYSQQQQNERASQSQSGTGTGTSDPNGLNTEQISKFTPQQQELFDKMMGNIKTGLWSNAPGADAQRGYMHNPQAVNQAFSQLMSRKSETSF